MNVITHTPTYTLSHHKASTPPPQQDPPEAPQDPEDKLPAWAPLANAAVVGGVIGVPSALGALENAFLGPEVATGLTWIATPIVAGLGVGYWAGRSAYEEFNGHPILTGLSALTAGGLAAAVSPFLKTPGAAFGWKGAAIATAIGAVGAGAATAIYMAKQTGE